MSSVFRSMDNDFDPIDTYRKTIHRATCRYCGELVLPRGIASHERKHEREMEEARLEQQWKRNKAKSKALKAPGRLQITPEKAQKLRKKREGRVAPCVDCSVVLI